MAELIKTLQMALEEVEAFGNSKAVDILDRALGQAYRIRREEKDKDFSGVSKYP